MSYSEPEMISIIEGPPPEFMLAQDAWSTSCGKGKCRARSGCARCARSVRRT